MTAIKHYHDACWRRLPAPSSFPEEAGLHDLVADAPRFCFWPIHTLLVEFGREVPLRSAGAMGWQWKGGGSFGRMSYACVAGTRDFPNGA